MEVSEEPQPRLWGSRRSNTLEDDLLLLPHASLRPLNVTSEAETSPPPSEQTFTTEVSGAEVRTHSDEEGVELDANRGLDQLCFWLCYLPLQTSA